MRYLTYQRLATAGATAVTMLALAAGAAAADGVRPDDRAMHGPGAIAVAQRDIVVRPDDRADRRLAGVAVVAQPAATKGFDWADAGVGALGTFGLVLLAGGVGVVALRRRPRLA